MTVECEGTKEVPTQQAPWESYIFPHHPPLYKE